MTLSRQCRSLVDTLDVMNKLDVGLNILAARGKIIGAKVLLGQQSFIVLSQAGLKCIIQQLLKLFGRTLRQRLTGPILAQFSQRLRSLHPPRGPAPCLMATLDIPKVAE